MRSELRWQWRCFTWWSRSRGNDVALWIAHRMPQWLRYWVTLDSIARSTTGQYGTTVVPELPAMEVLNRI